jgi:predicted cupin superfamily sugar epimerase
MDPEIARKIIGLLNLQPLSGEGGLYAETYHSELEIPQCALPARYIGDRRLGTAIYYALTGAEDSFSAMHRLATDEIYHFYL